MAKVKPESWCEQACDASPTGVSPASRSEEAQRVPARLEYSAIHSRSQNARAEGLGGRLTMFQTLQENAKHESLRMGQRIKLAPWIPAHSCGGEAPGWRCGQRDEVAVRIAHLRQR